MSITIIAIGKIKEPYLREGCLEYIKRLSAYTTLNIIEVDEYKLKEKPTPKEIDNGLQKEGLAISKYLKTQDYIIALAVEGTPLNSEKLAQKLDSLRMTNGSIVFLIGGSYGLSEEIKKRAHELWSLSDMTFPHQVARFVWLEQLYRAFKILNNETYHK